MNNIKNSYRELIYKIVTSIFVRGLLLIIPIFWSKIINDLSTNEFNKSYKLIIIIIILSIFYYIWQYLNQVTWFKLYDKLYIGYTKLIIDKSDNIKKSTLGEYTNVINNDIDIICNFLGNGIARIIQITEIIFILIYFITKNIYIFGITLIISIIMIILIIVTSSAIKAENVKRKSTLDKKTVIAHNLYDHIKEDSLDNNILNKFNSSTIEYLKANSKFNLLAQAIIYLVLGIIELSKYIIILYCIYLMTKENMEVGTILLVYTYYDKIITNFEVIGTISCEYQSFKVSLKRLNKLGNM